MSINTTLNTVQDLVNYVLRNPTHTQRYKLTLEDRNVWVNPEEGAAYEQLERPAYVSEYRDDGQPDYELRLAIYKQDEAVYRAQRPAEKRVEFGSLQYNLSSYHFYGVNLSPELTQMVKAVWTMKPYYGSLHPSGTITLKTLLKRLGAGNGIDNQINAAIAQKNEQERLTRRRNIRRYSAKLAAELLKYVTEHGADAGIDENMSLSELAGLDVEG